MALVEIEAGPHLVTAAVTRDAVEELGLAPGVPATAAVKATSVMVERGHAEARRGACRRRVACSAPAAAAETTPAAAAASRADRLRRIVAEGRRSRPTPGVRRAPTSSSPSPDPTSSPRRSARAVSPDVFAAANTKLPDALCRGGLLERAGRLRHQLARRSRYRRDSTLGLARDLAAPGVALAIGSESVPIGGYTRRGARPPAGRRRRRDPRQRAVPGARRDGIVGKLTQGAVDAGFVYRSDVTRRRRTTEGGRAARPAAADAWPTPPAIVTRTEHRGGGAATSWTASSRAAARERCSEAGFGPRRRDAPRAGSRSRCWRSPWPSRSSFLTLPLVARVRRTPARPTSSRASASRAHATRCCSASGRRRSRWR